MVSKINELFNIRLSKEGKKKVNEWLVDEFGSLYFSQKQLDSDDAIKDFINDMLSENNIKLQDLCIDSNNTIIKKNINHNLKQFKYCPYCGECIEFNLKEK